MADRFTAIPHEGGHYGEPEFQAFDAVTGYEYCLGCESNIRRIVALLNAANEAVSEKKRPSLDQHRLPKRAQPGAGSCRAG